VAKVIPFPKKQEDESQHEDNSRMELITRLWPPLIEAARQMRARGADRPQIIRMLRAALETLEEDEAKAKSKAKSKEQ
jgi:hypothetical protein